MMSCCPNVNGHTQNPNEISTTCFGLVSQKKFVGYYILKVGALDATAIFNGGAIGRVSRDPEYSGSCTAMFMPSIVRARAAAVRKTFSELAFKYS